MRLRYLAPTTHLEVIGVITLLWDSQNVVNNFDIFDLVTAHVKQENILTTIWGVVWLINTTRVVVVGLKDGNVKTVDLGRWYCSIEVSCVAKVNKLGPPNFTPYLWVGRQTVLEAIEPRIIKFKITLNLRQISWGVVRGNTRV